MRTTILGTLVLIAVLMGGCGGEPAEAPPWQVERLEGGGTEVLGLRPGTSTMNDVLARFGSRVEAALFESPGGELSVEAHYGSVAVAGLTGRLIVTLDVGPETLEALKRASPNYIFLDGGGRRHEIDATLGDALLSEEARVLTFVPGTRLEEPTLTARFGEAAARIEAADGGVHLLYPEIGTDVLVPPKGRPLIQYVHPRDFGWLRKEQGI